MAKRPIIPANWKIPNEIRERLGEQVGRQRAMFAEGHLLLILHELPTPEDIGRVARLFWRQPDGTWSSNSLGDSSKALKKHLDEYYEVIAKYEELDAKASNSKDYFAVLYDLAPIVRATRNMHQALQQARDSVPDDREILNFRDRAYRVERNAELLYGDAKMSLEFLIAQQSEEQAESSQQMAIASHRLNVLAAFFFPLATLAAIFGVNLELGLEKVMSVSQIGTDTMPGQPFMIMLVIGILLGFILKSFVTRGKSP